LEEPVTAPRATTAGLGLALLSAATFGTSGAFGRSLIDAGWSPAAAVTVRVTVAALLLAVPGVLALRGRWRVLRRGLGPVTLFGLTAIAGCQLCYFNAVQHVSIGVALLLEYMGTVLVVGWMWARHRQRPQPLTLAGAAVAVVGLVLVLDLLGGGHLDLVGVLWGLGAAVGLAVYFVVSSRTGEGGLPPVAMASAGMGIGAVALLALGGSGVLPMRATFGAVAFAGHRVSWLVPVVGLSLVAAVVAYVTGIHAARRLGAKLASFVGLTEVVFAVLFAWLLLGQLPTAVQLAGGVLIVAGIVLVRLDENRAVEPAVEPVPVVEAAA
jgi:drug/metabolite transporter (DMT)-like permease